IGLTSYRDLLYHLPRRYEDRRALPSFAALVEGENATVAGTLMSRAGSRSRRGLHVLRGRFEDGRGGRLTAVWFNQPWLEKQLYPGQRLVITGKVKRSGARAEVQVAAHEVDDDSGGSLSFNRIVGIYPS